jgi:hypothetical protein
MAPLIKPILKYIPKVDMDSIHSRPSEKELMIFLKYFNTSGSIPKGSPRLRN